jgi:hypothetical protein
MLFKNPGGDPDVDGHEGEVLRLGLANADLGLRLRWSAKQHRYDRDCKSHHFPAHVHPSLSGGNRAQLLRRLDDQLAKARPVQMQAGQCNWQVAPPPSIFCSCILHKTVAGATAAEVNSRTFADESGVVNAPEK